MKLKTGTGRKLRYGGITVLMTAAIIVAVIIVNIIATALIQGKALYPDLTPELEFTLSENCISLFENGDKNFEQSSSPIKKIDEFRTEGLSAAKAEKPDMTKDEENAKIEEIKKDTMINIIFCDTETAWSSEDSAMKHVWKTAMDIKNKFPEYVELKFIDIIRNPTAVSKYGAGLNQQSVIVSCGDEFRSYSLKSFYIYNSDDSETPWAYNGEKVIASAALAVTRASSPIACFTTGHNESIASNAFLTTLMTAGYTGKTVDLSTQDIPADCRLLIISAPDRDFLVPDGSTSDIDEIEKIEEFLDKGNALMVFMSSDLTEPLYNLEEFLNEWGIEYDRYQAEGETMVHPYRIRDLANSISSDTSIAEGENFLAKYVNYGLGNDITSLIAKENRKIIFTRATSISYHTPVTGNPVGYSEEDGGDILGDYCIFSKDGVTREMYPVFVTSSDAAAYANGVQQETAKNGNLFNLMTITVESRFIQEDDYGYSSSDNSSYVIASGCPDFITSDNMLSIAYGNEQFLESMLRTVGHEPVPTGLTFRPLGDFEIDTITDNAVIWNTVLFTAIPAVIALGTGVVIIVRRKNR